ncbi:unnamed protein product [Victoria cruziana]
MDSVVEGVRNKDTVERKRCLPPWMLGTTAADKEKSSKKQDNICISVHDEQRQPVGQSDHASSGIKKNVVLPPVKDASGDAIIRIRKSSKRTIENVNRVQKHEDVSEKKKSKRVITGEENNAQKLKRRSKTYSFRDSENSTKLRSSQSCSDIELSLDDLVSIAEEYVGAKAENDVQIEAGNVLPSESSSQSMSRHETKSEEVGMDFIKKGSLVNDGLPIKNMQCTAPVKISNAAEHMLNIFLGPAVWKPQEHKKVEPLEYMSQNHNLSNNLYSETVEGEEPPPVKKKGSLKERVAMFLD